MASTATYTNRNEEKVYVVVFYPFDYFRSKRKISRRVWKNQMITDRIIWGGIDTFRPGIVIHYDFTELTVKSKRKENCTTIRLDQYFFNHTVTWD